jgi:hypothetical protein
MVKARLDYEPLFSILDSLRLDSEWRNWLERRRAEEMDKQCIITAPGGFEWNLLIKELLP